MRKGSMCILSLLLASFLILAYGVGVTSASPGNSDDFSGSSLSSFWTKAGSVSATYDLTTNPGSLRMGCPANLDIGGSNDNAPRILQPVTGDFMILTKVTGSFTPAGTHAGIIVWIDNTHFVRVERRDVNKVQIGGKNGAGGFTATQYNLGSNVDPTYLKLEKVGTTVTGYWSSDGVAWNSFGTFTLTGSDPVQVGLFVINQNAAPLMFHSDFDFFDIVPMGIFPLPESPLGTLLIPLAMGGAFAVYKLKLLSRTAKAASV